MSALGCGSIHISELLSWSDLFCYGGQDNDLRDLVLPGNIDGGGFFPGLGWNPSERVLMLVGDERDLEILKLIGQHKRFIETRILQIKPGLADVNVKISIGGIRWN